jgi:hypothetical protein
MVEKNNVCRRVAAAVFNNPLKLACLLASVDGENE